MFGHRLKMQIKQLSRDRQKVFREYASEPARLALFLPRKKAMLATHSACGCLALEARIYHPGLDPSDLIPQCCIAIVPPVVSSLRCKSMLFYLIMVDRAGNEMQIFSQRIQYNIFDSIFC